MTLIRRIKTGNLIQVDDLIEDFHKNVWRLLRAYQGKLYCQPMSIGAGTINREFYPSVFDIELIELPD